MLIIDKLSGIPIYEQIINALELLIVRNIYPADTQLPSVRALSQEICVNPNTLQKAYTELERDRICYSVSGSGRYVSKDAKEIIRQGKLKKLDEIAELAAALQTFGVTREQIAERVNSVFGGAKNNEEAEKI